MAFAYISIKKIAAMSQPQTPQTLSVAEKEKIIELKVKQYKEEQEKLPFNQRKFSFSTNGEAMTRLIRDAWSSDMPIYSIQKLCIESLIGEDKDNRRMKLDLAVKLVTGKMMLIGDSRIDSYPGGIELVDDDGRYNEDYENYSVETMIERIESYYIKDANYRAVLVRVLNMLKNDIEDEDDPIQLTGDANGEWLTPHEIREKIKYLGDRVKKFTDELDFLYPLVKKTLRDLPNDRVGTEAFDIEHVIAEAQSRGKKLQKGAREREEREDRQKREEAEEARELKRAAQDLEDHRHLITPIKDEELRKVTSCWLLPDGTMFGGVGYAFIHDHMLYYLKESKYFKVDRIDEKDVEKMGWCKLSRGHGFYLHQHLNDDLKYTEAQRQRIIDWCLAHEVERVRINNYKVPLKHLMEMDCNDMMEYSEWQRSDRNPFKDEPIDPNANDLTDDELYEMFPPAMPTAQQKQARLDEFLKEQRGKKKKK